MNRGTALRRAAAAVAALLISGGVAAADVILLRDGGQKHGALSACDQNSCRIGAESVARTSIDWIGLDRDVPAPAVRNPERDELHLANNSVQSVTLTGIDAGFVYASLGGQGFAAASRLPRPSVAWIHLGRPRQGATEPETAPAQAKDPTTERKKETTREELAKNRAARADGAPWRLPSHIYTWTPPNCPTCNASLSVIDLRVQDDDVLILKSRIIKVGPNRLNATWLTFDRPLPLFPATTDVARFLYQGKGTAHIMLESYSASDAHAGAAGGGSGSGSAPASTAPGPSADGTAEDPLAHAFSQSLSLPDMWARRLADAWRQRIANERAADQGQAAAAPAGAQSRQHVREEGEVTYRHAIRVTNWPIVAGEIAGRGGEGLEPWKKLVKSAIYDVEIRLDFEWTNVSGRSRTRDSRGYTTDDVWQRGPHAPGPGSGTRPVFPENSSPAEPEPQRSQIEEFLYGDPLKPVREAARPRAAQEWERAMQGIGNALAGDVFGDGADAGQSTRSGQGTIAAVFLGMRWSRADGRISAHYGTDILRYIDLLPEPVRWIVSGTRPQHAFDVPGAPPWTSPNPRPPPQPDNFGGTWLRR